MLQGLTLFNSESFSIFDTLSQYLLLTNLMFAVSLIVFVMFFCIRSLSNTKTASFIIVVSFIPFLLFFPVVIQNLYNNLYYLCTQTCAGKVGLAFCVISLIMLLLGFRDEELSVQYVHSRFYWISMVVFAYFGLFMVSIGLLGSTPAT